MAGRTMLCNEWLEKSSRSRRSFVIRLSAGFSQRGDADDGVATAVAAISCAKGTATNATSKTEQ